MVSGVLACSMILVPMFSNAQTPGVPAREEALQALGDSAWVRLAGPTFGRVEGRVLARTPTDLVLIIDSQHSRIPATSIDTLWARGKATRTGALLGGLLGAGIGILVATQTVEEGESLEQTIPSVSFDWRGDPASSPYNAGCTVATLARSTGRTRRHGHIGPTTATGVRRGSSVPSPTWPQPFPPQQ